DIRYLSKARSAKQFKALSKLFLEFWIQQNERDNAKWFEDIYLGDTWGNWFYVAAAAGITPSQNALEAHHRVIKKVCVGTLRASIAVVLNDSIPRILGLQESEPARPALNHFSEGPFMSGVVARAQTLVQEKSNHYMIKDTRAKFVKAFLFNASKFVVSPKNIHSAVLNRDRATIYRNSINGKLPPGMTVNLVELHCLSIHQIQAIRKKYVCDCALFYQTGWQCSHVVTAMTLQKEISIQGMLKALPTRKLSGGQRKRVGPLTEGGDNTHRFSQFLLGKGISWGETNGVFFWMTKFSNGAQVKLECQELAECLNRAYTHGADVAGAVAI
ncbi:hypothetical protein PHYSODRAFT_404990, partial [Phytophthora sojae]